MQELDSKAMENVSGGARIVQYDPDNMMPIRLIDDKTGETIWRGKDLKEAEAVDKAHNGAASVLD